MDAKVLFCRLLSLSILIQLSEAQLPSVWKPDDIITFFCSRWYHQSVVKNDVLHVYGGIQTFNVPDLSVKSTNNTLGHNPFLLQVDLANSWDWQKNMSWHSINVAENPKTGAHVRHAMVNGAMYAGPYNSTNIWTYGGTTFRGNKSFLDSDKPYANQYPLWSFDDETNNWDQFDLGQLTTPSRGLSAQAPDQGLAFYLNGQIDNGTEPNTWAGGDSISLLEGMMVIDLAHQTARNVSTSSLRTSQPRSSGAMQYVPGVGDSGVLVALGGRMYGGMRTLTSQDKGSLLTFDTIDVYDIASYSVDSGANGTWHQQRASGDIPPPRIDTCTVVASAPDNSTHNIYLYGGWVRMVFLTAHKAYADIGKDPTGNENKWYDDIYVLTLPSFTWIKMYQAESPRYGHTCHLVGRQLLTIGGHNVRRNQTNMCDWETQSIAILDLPSMTWGSVFNATNGEYELSPAIVEKVGGTSRGGAAMKQPVVGWSSPKLESIMSSTRIYSNVNGTIDIIRATPTTSITRTNKRTAIIAGATATAVLFLFINCVTWILYLRRRRQSIDGLTKQTIDDRDWPEIQEVEGKAKFELSPDEKRIYEMKGEDWRHEAPDTRVRAEADPGNAVTHAFELPATNFSKDGKWGVPIIKEPTPCSSRRASTVAGGTVVSIVARKDSSDMA
ncbi:hypothetical protein LEMA_P066250.1 [Plenodomus lingam JN3]|uniref:Kelch repeat protein n=1 Tax=Leptosphaeria maculans (strain JN3 / isolate v23.1.3 / race Av1-4-5-6-7-8) TaxID=985895 RepID=E4ZGS9_LEPMJ|nr:hypothetical protein LEMA_P066250.1 [Plenodomus lingam JN3]CBX90499.1 hypothetical protein LEMA_P066250.1 [Plenodomus lingam JN3]